MSEQRTTIELLAELVTECGRGAAYELRERLGHDGHVERAVEPLVPAQLTVLLRRELGVDVPESTDTDEGTAR